MSALPAAERRRLMVAAACATVVVGGFFALVRVPPSSPLVVGPDTPAARAVARTAVRLTEPAKAEPVLAEVLALRDMRPLFLPTERNVAHPESRMETGRTFLDKETARLTFPDSELNLEEMLPPVAQLNGKPPHEARPADALAPDMLEFSLLGFGRRPVSAPAVSERGGYVQVVSAATGETLWGTPLAADARPPGNKPWGPIVFLATVDPAGLVAPLLVAESSRAEEVDTHFRLYLMRTLRIGERLTPGFYRIVVGP